MAFTLQFIAFWLPHSEVNDSLSGTDIYQDMRDIDPDDCLTDFEQLKTINLQENVHNNRFDQWKGMQWQTPFSS